jgi:hypothetical protein
MPPSGAITWLDFRRDDLNRARDFIQSLQGEGVLDELGFLALQGQFSDVFYPATSTLMRSARYFFFVAAVYRQLERDRVTSVQVGLELRRRLDALREVLARNEQYGVLGREAKMNIKQLPSAVYWNGLRRLGMFTSDLSEAGYQARFDELRSTRRGFSDDDKTEQASDQVGFWDPKLPTPRFIDEDGTFRPSTKFQLSRTEANDLARRFRDRFPKSLFVHLLDAERPEVPFPWAAPRPAAELATYLEHAKALALFARGATLQYYALLLEARGRAHLPVPELGVEAAFESWWLEARKPLCDWDPQALATLPRVNDALRHGDRGDIAFFRGWLARLSNHPSATALLGDADARALVRKRELDVKPAKARLKHRRHLEQWHTQGLGDQLYGIEYRHGIGTRILAEVLVGLERNE